MANDYKIDNILSKKHAYIVVKIIDANHSLGDFADFLDRKRQGSGSDLNLISLEELKSYVTEFIGLAEVFS